MVPLRCPTYESRDVNGSSNWPDITLFGDTKASLFVLATWHDTYNIYNIADKYEITLITHEGAPKNTNYSIHHSFCSTFKFQINL